MTKTRSPLKPPPIPRLGGSWFSSSPCQSRPFSCRMGACSPATRAGERLSALSSVSSLPSAPTPYTEREPSSTTVALCHIPADAAILPASPDLADQHRLGDANSEWNRGIARLKLARQELLPGWAPFLACRSGPATELWAALGRPNAGSTTETYGILQVVMFRVDVGGEPQTPVSLPGATKRWKSPEQNAPGATL